MKLIERTSRVALVALLHDLEGLAERAQITGSAWAQLEETGYMPGWLKNGRPFPSDAGGSSGDVTDPVANTTGERHLPEDFLRQIIVTANHVASGFEREKPDAECSGRKNRDRRNHARLLTLFEQMGRQQIKADDLDWCYPLEPLGPMSIFPRPRKECTPANQKGQDAAINEYRDIWDFLLKNIQRIPASHRANLPLWLDHFDSLWLTATQAVPSVAAFGDVPAVSLYDHSKAAAALAAALWRWHHETGSENVDTVRNGWEEEKFLLVQGDFFGIQDFIFANGGATQKHAHKLLRGRSFQVSLLAECAALKVLEALQLPSIAQITNAAGKFMIVAPNTRSARDALARCRAELNAWCLKHTYGEIGVGIAATPAACNDFVGGRFGDLHKRLFAALDIAKHQRFGLCNDQAPADFADFLDRFDNTLGVCQINGKYPASRRRTSGQNSYALSDLADDQIRIGEGLTKNARILVTREAERLPVLSLDYFGYRLAFVPDADVSGKYGELAGNGTLVRAWDFDAPDDKETVWRGYARRFVNNYVPRFNEDDEQQAGKYAGMDSEDGAWKLNEIKTLSHIACEDRYIEDCHNEEKRWRSEIALVALKGDIDNLGALFQQGVLHPTLAKAAALSRQVNAFFSLWLPWFCEYGRNSAGQARYRNTYTVFAGGDDFFLIGPWESTIELAGVLRGRFAEYVVNKGITFSAGLTMTKSKMPVRHLAQRAEDALDAAKARPAKDAVHLWGHSVAWDDWRALMDERRTALETLMARAESMGASFSTGLVYALLQLSDRTESSRPEDALWRSQLHYRLARFFHDRARGGSEAERKKLLEDAIAEIGNALAKYKGAYRLPLSVLLYRQRE